MKLYISYIIQLFLFLFPWFIRRRALQLFFGWTLSRNCHIGFSLLGAKMVVLDNYASIGHLNICKRIDKIRIGEKSSIGNCNKITGFPTNDKSVIHFHHVKDRKCELVIGRETGITSNHYFDCNAGIYIGDFCQIAGFDSAFMTHSIDIKNCIQDASSIKIGDYVFVGARCLILKGVSIAGKTVISAMSLVNRDIENSQTLYGGIPAKYLKDLSESKFFIRQQGFV